MGLLMLPTLMGCGGSSFGRNTIGLKKNSTPEARQNAKPAKENLINEGLATAPKKRTAVEVGENAKPGLKTLIDKENGYSFAYPEDWILDNEMRIIKREEKIISPFKLTNLIYYEYKPYPTEGDISFHLNIYESALPLDDWFEKFGDYSKAGIEKKKLRIKQCCEKIVEEKNFEAVITETKKDGILGIVSYGKTPVVEEGYPTTSKSYLYQKDGKIYKFWFVTTTGPKAKEVIKIFDEVMDSLKFI